MTKTTKIVMNEDEDFNNGDGKTTKLWISPALELRYAINGWPEVPPVKASIYADTFAMQQYEKKLAKAKVESILVEQSDNTPITMFKGVLEPDEFIDFEGEVEVVCQQRRIFNGGWTDCSEEHYKSQYRSFPKLFRQVARLKPVDKSQLDSAGDTEMNEALDALKDPKGRQDQGAGAGQCGSDAADGVRYT